MTLQDNLPSQLRGVVTKAAPQVRAIPGVPQPLTRQMSELPCPLAPLVQACTCSCSVRPVPQAQLWLFPPRPQICWQVTPPAGSAPGTQRVAPRPSSGSPAPDPPSHLRRSPFWMPGSLFSSTCPARVPGAGTAHQGHSHEQCLLPGIGAPGGGLSPLWGPRGAPGI